MLIGQMKKHEQVPKVFISSTVKGIDPKDSGLKPYREEIYRIITSEFGWDCICSEESGQYFGGLTFQLVLML